MTEVESIPTAAEPRAIRPIDEFRKWIVVAPILAMVGTGLFFVADHWHVREVLGRPIIWGVFSLGEAWIQFRRVPARLGWIVAGALTGWRIMEMEGYHTIYVVPWFLIPAVVECGSAWRFRRNAWVWLIVTPGIYGSIPWWLDRAGVLVDRTLSHLQSQWTFLAALPTEIAGLTCLLGLTLCVRAFVGSFIARPREGA